MLKRKQLTKQQKEVRALKAQLPLAAKPKLKPLNKLRKEADEWHSRYIRLRDCTFNGQQWIGTCITCTKTGVVAYLDPDTAKKRVTKNIRYTSGWDNGHFMGRGELVTRFNEQNVNLQCSYRCNGLRHGEHEKYRLALKLKYGDEVPEQLENLVRTTSYFKLDRAYLEQIIAMSKEYVLAYSN